MDYDATKKVLAALEREGVRYTIFGAVALNLHGLEVAVVTPLTLYQMKKDTVRPKGWGDAEWLRQHFGFEE